MTYQTAELCSFCIMRYALSSLAVDAEYADCLYPIKCDLCGTMTDDQLCLSGDLTYSSVLHITVKLQNMYRI